MKEKLKKFTGKTSLIVLKSALKNNKMSCFVGPQALVRL